MKTKTILLSLLLVTGLALPPAGFAAATSAMDETDTVATQSTGDPVENEGDRLEKTAATAAIGAAIGSVWPGPGTLLGLVAGGIYGFFFR